MEGLEPVADDGWVDGVDLERLSLDRVDAVYDVGVAGIHRLLGNAERLGRARVVVVCAGMEGALPSVVGGLVSCPVIAVPTSIGYGASFNGLAALLLDPERAKALGEAGRAAVLGCYTIERMAESVVLTCCPPAPLAR